MENKYRVDGKFYRTLKEARKAAPQPKPKERDMEVAYYTRVETYDGVSEIDIIRRAHTLGYEMVRFEGFSDWDLGSPGMPGPMRDAAQKNRAKLAKIAKTFDRDNSDGTYDCVVFFQSQEAL